MDNKKKIYIIVSLIFILIFMLVFVLHSRSLSVKVKLVIAPSVARLTINNKVVSPGTIRVKPGTYTVIGTMNGFALSSKTVTVKKGDSIQVGLALSSNSASTSNWYSAHPGDESIAEGISGYNNDVLYQQSSENAPIIKILPFTGPDFAYRIDYGTPAGANANKPIIYITAPDSSGQQEAQAWMKSQGYDTSKLDIQYVIGQP